MKEKKFIRDAVAVYSPEGLSQKQIAFPDFKGQILDQSPLQYDLRFGFPGNLKQAL